MRHRDEDLGLRSSGSSIFASISAATEARLAAVASRLMCDAGQVLFLQGDPGDALYRVESGSVEISVVTAKGKKLSLNVMRENEVFGEIAALDGGIRTATATVLEPTRLARVTRSDVLALIAHDPEVATDLITVLCDRLRWVSQIVEDFGLAGIEERLASRLILLDRKMAKQDGKLKLSQSELADFLGVTRESVNKVLRLWEEAGLIGLSRGSILIRDHSQLSSLTN